MIKSLFAGVLALALNPSEQTAASTTFVYSPFMEKISCAEGSGTGFKLDTGQWVTAWHVAKMTACEIDGRPIAVVSYDELGDSAIFDVPGDHRRGGYHADCSGFHDGEWYWAEGHGLGLPIAQAVPIMFSKVMQAIGSDRGWGVFVYNQVIHGQSGGPVLSPSGEVAGIVNALHPLFPISYSRALKDTGICKH